MNGPTRLKLYKFITERDGEYCKCCGKLSSERQLVVDHRDNNSKNNSLENLQILCRRCNYLKNPRRPLDECVSECETVDQSSELAVNRVKEPLFKQYVATRINEEAQISEEDLVNAGAERLDLSPVTTKRYLNKLCSSDGIYERKRIGKTVVIRYKEEISHM